VFFIFTCKGTIYGGLLVVFPCVVAPCHHLPSSSDKDILSANAGYVFSNVVFSSVETFSKEFHFLISFSDCPVSTSTISISPLNSSSTIF
jgi:hypothetical protein